MNSLHIAAFTWAVVALTMAIFVKPIPPWVYFWSAAAIIAYVVAEVVRLLREKP
jgi:hypothetical protein